jgi:hypothetical protein
MLKYKSNDVFNLIDTFAELSEKGVDGLEDAMVTITKYPPKVIQTFLKCIEDLKEEMINKDNYWGIIGVITMRINFADMRINEIE